ncbi:unnamed protein product [Peniophora sp. CBMAI 1063]|nr:unnamed protein product [Peniophora sp. CBMAI 1063]
MADSDKSLLEFLDSSQIHCLNETEDHTLKSVLQKTGVYVESDADEQLLMSIPFNQTVRVRSISFKCTDESKAPKKIKLLVNRQSIDFADVADAVEPEVAQVLELTPEQVKDGRKIPLRFVRFQSVNTLNIFVESNQGDEESTKINSIDLFGVPVESTKDLSGLHKQDED